MPQQNHYDKLDCRCCFDSFLESYAFFFYYRKGSYYSSKVKLGETDIEICIVYCFQPPKYLDVYRIKRPWSRHDFSHIFFFLDAQPTRVFLICWVYGQYLFILQELIEHIYWIKWKINTELNDLLINCFYTFWDVKNQNVSPSFIFCLFV